MNYHSTNRQVKVGDVVRYAGKIGKIVFIVDDDAFSPAHPKAHWSYLTKGLGVKSEEGKWSGGLFVLNSSENHEDLELIE